MADEKPSIAEWPPHQHFFRRAISETWRDQSAKKLILSTVSVILVGAFSWAVIKYGLVPEDTDLWTRLVWITVGVLGTITSKFLHFLWLLLDAPFRQRNEARTEFLKGAASESVPVVTLEPMGKVVSKVIPFRRQNLNSGVRIELAVRCFALVPRGVDLKFEICARPIADATWNEPPHEWAHPRSTQGTVTGQILHVADGPAVEVTMSALLSVRGIEPNQLKSMIDENGFDLRVVSKRVPYQFDVRVEDYRGTIPATLSAAVPVVPGPRS